MSLAHRSCITALIAVILLITAAIGYLGFSYYRLPLEDRFFHAGHNILKPGGIWGHGFGIIGTLLIIAGVSLYMIRKRVRSLSRFGLVKYWLEFHIFLCTLGPVLILYHTAFKFGGIVAVSFWSMVAVFLSGIIGRFIYIQIPRTIEGRELSLNEIRDMKSNIPLERRLKRLATMRKLFNYWHVAHLPFAIVMLIIMVIHVAVTIVFGYRWIF